jgi:hypothetical protein
MGLWIGFVWLRRQVDVLRGLQSALQEDSDPPAGAPIDTPSPQGKRYRGLSA